MLGWTGRRRRGAADRQEATWSGGHWRAAAALPCSGTCPSATIGAASSLDRQVRPPRRRIADGNVSLIYPEGSHSLRTMVPRALIKVQCPHGSAVTSCERRALKHLRLAGGRLVLPRCNLHTASASKQRIRERRARVRHSVRTAPPRRPAQGHPRVSGRRGLSIRPDPARSACATEHRAGRIA